MPDALSGREMEMVKAREAIASSETAANVLHGGFALKKEEARRPRSTSS
jgi:hypothetical protein